MKPRNNFILCVATCLVFSLPSILFSFIEANYNIVFEDTLFIFVFFALFLASVPNKISLFILSIFILMELVQFAHLSYYKFPVASYTLGLIWSEKFEILEGGLGSLKEIWYFPFLVLIPYGFLIFLYTKLKRRVTFFAVIPLILILGILPYKILFLGSDANNNIPVYSRLSIFNSLRTFSYFIFGNKNIILNTYSNYSYIKNNVDNINIVVIFGESVNYNFMSLFGYQHETNPKLNLIKDNLIHKKSFSSSPLTTVSTSMFFNLTREIDNVSNQIKGDFNLFKLAKENMFITAYLSAQEENLLNKIHPKNIDYIITKENIKKQLQKQADFYLIDLLKAKKNDLVDKNKRNFIVLHQRNAHVPYEYNYRNYQEFNVFKGDDRLSAYQNAMLMNDFFLYNVIQSLEMIVNDKPTYIYFVSDHSESLGDKEGRLGHGFLSEETVNVPFIYTCFNCEKDKQIEDLYYPTHYEISKIIAKKLGFEIINPNENGDFYINGPSIYGDQGHWVLKKDIAQKEFTIIKNK